MIPGSGQSVEVFSAQAPVRHWAASPVAAAARLSAPWPVGHSALQAVR